MVTTGVQLGYLDQQRQCSDQMDAWWTQHTPTYAFPTTYRPKRSVCALVLANIPKSHLNEHNTHANHHLRMIPTLQGPHQPQCIV